MFVCLRPIFLYFVHQLSLKVFFSVLLSLGVLNQLKSSIRLVCLRPIFLYFFTNVGVASVCLFAFGLYFQVLIPNPYFFHICVKRLDVTITVSWSSCGLYFARTSPTILSSIFDLRSQISNSFEALPHSESTEVPRMPLALCLMEYPKDGSSKGRV